MTLVFATHTPLGITLYSDWRLTREGHTRPPSFESGGLKLWILRPDRCIAFAGNYEVGTDTLRSITDRDLADTSTLLRRLVKVHEREVSGGIEFLVATLGDRAIFQVKDGAISRREVAWIGDFLAFRELQRIRQTYRKTSSSDDAQYPEWAPLSSIGRAFDELIREGSISTVGELSLSVATDNDGFIYAPRAAVFGGFGEQVIPPGAEVPVDVGTAETGAFAYTILGAERHPAIGVYYPHGGLGHFFFPMRRPYPWKYTGVDQLGFISSVFRDTGVRLRAGIDFG